MKKEMDVLKSLGISTTQRSLVQQDQTFIKSQQEQTNLQPIRKGLEMSARDRLEQQISKGMVVAMSDGPQMVRVSPHADDGEDRSSWEKTYQKKKEKADENFRKESREKNAYEGTLKNTHGEEFHDDNDSQVEDMVSGVEEVDREFDGQSRPSKSTPRYWDNTQDGEKTYGYKSLSRDELFLKAFAEQDEEFFVKSRRNRALPAKPSKVAPHMAKDPVQAKQERAERRAAKGELVDWAKEEEREHAEKSKGRCWTGYKPVPGKKPYSEDSCVKKSSLDEIFEELTTIQKGKFKEAKIDEDVLMNVHENSPGVVEEKNKKPAQKDFKIKQNNKFVKSIGQGGIVFDFGHLTGNPIADHATQLLNQFADPVQESNAQYQQQSYQKAISDYAVKGDQSFAQDASPFGNVGQGWGDQLNKPMDQQVKEAFEKGMFDEKQGPNNPKFEKSVTTVGGQKVQAQSETDAAVLEMFKAEQEAMNKSDGFVVDASSGGKINVIAGIPLENQLPPQMLENK